MSFDERFGVGEPPDDEPAAEEYSRPVWLGPPEDELGVAVPQNTVIGRSDHGAIALSHVVVHSTGVAFDFLAQARGLKQSQANRLFHEQHAFAGDEIPDGVIRIGLELADGTRVSNISSAMAHRRLFAEPDRVPEGPVFIMNGGGGGMSSSDGVTMRPGYWLWPLPPPGPLTVWCEWPVVGIALTSVELDAAAIVEASQRTTPLWPEG